MKGIYVLLVLLRKNTKIRIGALGIVAFRRGLYAYVGSAQNSIEKRIARHLSKQKKKFWHIDYLLCSRHARIVGAYYKIAEKQEECHIARLLSEKNPFIKGFGCSDCSCSSHLFMIKDRKVFSGLGLKSYSTVN